MAQVSKCVHTSWWTGLYRVSAMQWNNNTFRSQRAYFLYRTYILCYWLNLASLLLHELFIALKDNDPKQWECPNKAKLPWRIMVQSSESVTRKRAIIRQKGNKLFILSCEGNVTRNVRTMLCEPCSGARVWKKPYSGVRVKRLHTLPRQWKWCAHQYKHTSTMHIKPLWI